MAIRKIEFLIVLEISLKTTHRNHEVLGYIMEGNCLYLRN